MLSPQYLNLTGNEQLNFVKNRLNTTILKNVKENYHEKKELGNITDISQLENKESLNPFLLEKSNEVNALIPQYIKLINKVISIVDKINSSFESNYKEFGFIRGDIGASLYKSLLEHDGELRVKFREMRFAESLIIQYPELISKENITQLKQILVIISANTNNFNQSFFKSNGAIKQYIKPSASKSLPDEQFIASIINKLNTALKSLNKKIITIIELNQKKGNIPLTTSTNPYLGEKSIKGNGFLLGGNLPHSIPSKYM